MRGYVKYLLVTFFLTLVILWAIILGIILFPKGTFHSSYQSMIVDKYRLLQRTNEPKIIMVSGSSSTFGLNQNMLEDASGYKVVNLGLHVGFGHLFYSELSKENVNPGDIVLLGYEYDWQNEWQNGFTSLGQDLIMSGIDDNIDMYKHIPINHWGDFIGYIFQYAQLKNSYKDASGIYSREAFDEQTTQLLMDREYEMDYPNHVNDYGKVDLTNVQISDSSVAYLKKYKDFVEKRGAKVYFVSPPILKKAVACDYREFDKLRELEIQEIGIPYISNPEDYFFEDELMSNHIYHCSKEGETLRTQLLIQDLKRAKVIE